MSHQFELRIKESLDDFDDMSGLTADFALRDWFSSCLAESIQDNNTINAGTLKFEFIEPAVNELGDFEADVTLEGFIDIDAVMGYEDIIAEESVKDLLPIELVCELRLCVSEMEGIFFESMQNEVDAELGIEITAFQEIITVDNNRMLPFSANVEIF